MIADGTSQAYSDGMILPRLMRVLTLLAVLLAPLTMMSSHASAAPMQMAHAMDASSMTAGHCPPAGEEQDKQKPTPNIDCMIMCSAMPASENAFPEQIAMPALDLAQPVEARSHGLNPSADPPPPRLS